MGKKGKLVALVLMMWCGMVQYERSEKKKRGLVWCGMGGVRSEEVWNGRSGRKRRSGICGRSGGVGVVGGIGGIGIVGVGGMGGIVGVGGVAYM